jgi:hypothetical protein
VLTTDGLASTSLLNPIKKQEIALGGALYQRKIKNGAPQGAAFYNITALLLS